MPAGLEVYDALGRPTVRLTDRLGAIVGVFSTGTSPGSITLPGLSRGTPFYTVQTGWSSAVGASNLPQISISGTTVSWSIPFPGDTQSVIVYVGVY